MNSNVQDGVILGKYYAQQRGIPESNLFVLPLDDNEAITREEYVETLLLPLKETILARNLSEKIKIVVTTFGVPLRITQPEPTTQDQKWKADASRWVSAGTEFLISLMGDLTDLGDPKKEDIVKENSTQRALVEANPQKQGHQSEAMIHSFTVAVKKAQGRIQNLQNLQQKKRQEHTLQAIIRKFEGISGFNNTSFTHQVSPELFPQDPLQLKKSLQNMWGLLNLIIQHPSDSNRELTYKLAQQFFGIKGVILLAQKEMEILSYKDAEASIDSELSLLWWGPDLYHPSGRMPNPLYAWQDSTIHHTSPVLPVLMVARLDGPNPDLVKNMIDMALLAEQFGLGGTVYIDARGQKTGSPFSYGYYDQNLRDTAAFIQKSTHYKVVLENTENRFSQPGDAPNVSLYVGWYRLRSYEDAFTFNPGAIGWHIASGEAVSLHNSFEKGWCKNALERGITATLGPTSEPYLDAFPLPTEFFGLLFTGKYSLVEAFFLTTRYVSWSMVLIGDPLYNPWKPHPLVSFDALVNSIPRLKDLGKLPFPPAQLTWPNPILAGDTIRKQQATLLNKISSSVSY